MAYILLALGAVMSLVGLVAMITGYPSIEMERGWATVISGAVLLSGGLIVVALGLVVRNLVGLRNALPIVGAPVPSGTQAPQPFVPAPLMPAISAGPPPFEMPTTQPAAAFDPHPTLGLAVPAGVAAFAASGALRDQNERNPPPFPDTPPAHEPLAATHDSEPRLQEAHALEGHALEGHASDAFVAEANTPEAHPPEPAREHEPPQPVEAPAAPEHASSDGDWLDQAFSAFDHEMTSGRADGPSPLPEPHPEPAHAHAQEPATEPAHDAEPHAQHAFAASEEHHGEHHEPEPHAAPAEAPSTAPAEPAADLAVIGRYDSEGTSYVMYSDGSIEAQSEAGVYRFGSMAELKAFIEN